MALQHNGARISYYNDVIHHNLLRASEYDLLLRIGVRVSI